MLEKENNEELKNIGETFKKLLENTKKNEYWRIKTGILGKKIPSSNNDSLEFCKYMTTLIHIKIK